MNGRQSDLIVRRFSAENCPCAECENRKALCHSTCEEYMKYNSELEKLKTDLKNRRLKEFQIDSYLIQSTIKNARKKEKER